MDPMKTGSIKKCCKKRWIKKKMETSPTFNWILYELNLEMVRTKKLPYGFRF